jgi:Sulfotransferase domain
MELVTANGQALRLPDFIAVGPPRTATTWLQAVLDGHVGLPRIKETNFFTRHYENGVESYAKNFSHARPDRPVGEICGYFHHEQARERIARHLPGCKIICTFRDPVERAYSVYRMRRRIAAIREIDFGTALSTVPQIIESSRYAHHLRAWQSLFGDDRVLVMFYDDLRTDSQAFIDRICDFIAAPRLSLQDVSVGWRAENTFARAPRNRRLARKARRLLEGMRERRMYATIKVLELARFWEFCFGRGEKFTALDPRVEARLRESMRPEIEALEAMLNRDLSIWKRPRAAREDQRYGGRARGLAGV